MSEQLTTALIRGLQPKKNRHIVTDNKTKGFAVVTYPSGQKRFYYRYRPSGSKRIFEECVGDASIMSLREARKRVTILIGEVAKGVDIREARKIANRPPEEDLSTNLQLFNYIKIYYTPYAKKHSVTADEIVSTLEREFKFLENKPIDKINSHDIDMWREKRANKITFSTIKRIYTYLKACINTAVKYYKLIDKYELQTYSLKRRINEKINQPKLRYMSKPEEDRLLNALKDRDQTLKEKRARYVEWQSIRKHGKRHQKLFSAADYPDHITPIIIIAYHTGYDLGDIFDLDWNHIDFDNNQLSKVRNKTKHKQDNPQPVVVPMTLKVKEILEQWGKQHGQSGRIFTSPVNGGRLDNITNGWNKVKKSADLDEFRFKDFRHTYGSWLAIDGVDILDIRDLLGHSDIKTTQIYAHLCPQKKKESVIAVFK